MEHLRCEFAQVPEHVPGGQREGAEITQHAADKSERMAFGTAEDEESGAGENAENCADTSWIVISLIHHLEVEKLLMMF